MAPILLPSLAHAIMPLSRDMGYRGLWNGRGANQYLSAQSNTKDAMPLCRGCPRGCPCLPIVLLMCSSAFCAGGTRRLGGKTAKLASHLGDEK